MLKSEMKNADFMLAARDGERLVGVAKLMTNQGHVGYIESVCVAPDYQGLGIGGELVERVEDWFIATIFPGQRKKLYLLSAQGKREFYSKFGFGNTPDERFEHVMHKTVY